MRKLFKLAAAVLALGCAIGVASCGGKDEKLIKIQFIPSQDASIINTQAPKLEKLLEERMPGYKFEIKVGTDYTAVVNAMLAGQCDVGFLSAQQYAQVSVENPGKVEPILTSVRSAYQVQIDYQGDVENQIKAMNGEITDYEYLGQQAEQSVTYYNSICITMRDSGINSVTDLAGKKVATQKTSSGAGYVYPAVLLNKNNLKFVTTTPDASKGEVQAVTQNGYPAAVSAVLSGDVDAAWLFIDVRYTAFYNNKDSEYYQNAEIFTKTKVIALSDGIYNDTISVVSTMKDEVKAQLQNAFLALVNDEGEGAEALYKIYSHKGYKLATDEDYAGERDVYNFKKEHLN